MEGQDYNEGGQQEMAQYADLSNAEVMQ